MSAEPQDVRPALAVRAMRARAIDDAEELLERATYKLPRVALSIEEACGALGISWDLWHEHVAHDVRMVRLGRRRLVPVAELQKWLATHAELALEDDG